MFTELIFGDDLSVIDFGEENSIKYISDFKSPISTIVLIDNILDLVGG